jgi:hypothetical protein
LWRDFKNVVIPQNLSSRFISAKHHIIKGDKGTRSELRSSTVTPNEQFALLPKIFSRETLEKMPLVAKGKEMFYGTKAAT